VRYIKVAHFCLFPGGVFCFVQFVFCFVFSIASYLCYVSSMCCANLEFGLVACIT
jgi:hypothetical protein